MDLAGNVSCIPLIYYVLEWCKFIVTVNAVNAVIDRNEPYIFTREIKLGVLSGQNVIASEAAQIFNDHAVYLSVLNITDHALEIGSVEICSRPAVINIFVIDIDIVVCCILAKHLPLRLDT